MNEACVAILFAYTDEWLHNFVKALAKMKF